MAPSEDDFFFCLLATSPELLYVKQKLHEPLKLKLIINPFDAKDDCLTKSKKFEWFISFSSLGNLTSWRLSERRNHASTAWAQPASGSTRTASLTSASVLAAHASATSMAPRSGTQSGRTLVFSHSAAHSSRIQPTRGRWTAACRSGWPVARAPRGERGLLAKDGRPVGWPSEARVTRQAAEAANRRRGRRGGWRKGEARVSGGDAAAEAANSGRGR